MSFGMKTYNNVVKDFVIKYNTTFVEATCSAQDDMPSDKGITLSSTNPNDAAKVFDKDSDTSVPIEQTQPKEIVFDVTEETTVTEIFVQGSPVNYEVTIVKPDETTITPTMVCINLFILV